MIDSWKATLTELAEGLDLDHNAEDRATFRTRVVDKARHTSVSHMRQVLRELGYANPPQGRGALLRQLADFWIILPPADRLPASAKATDAQRREQAEHIARVATALAQGRVAGPVRAQVALLEEAVALLKAWTPDDRT